MRACVVRVGVLAALVLCMVGGLLPLVPRSVSAGSQGLPLAVGLPAAQAQSASDCGDDHTLRTLTTDADGDGADDELRALDPPLELTPPTDATRELELSVCVADDGTWNYAPGGQPTTVVRDESAQAETDLLAEALSQDVGDTIAHTTPELTGTSGHPMYVGLETWIEIDDASWNPSPSVPGSREGVTVAVTIEPVRVLWEIGDLSGECDNQGELPPPDLGADFAEVAPCGFTPERVADDTELRVWVEYRVTATGSLTGATSTTLVTSDAYSRNGRIDEVQAFGVAPEGQVDIPPPGNRSYGGDDSDCSLNPFTWGDCARDAIDVVVRVVVAGGRLVYEAGELVIDGHRYVVNAAWELTEAIANGLVAGVDMLWDLAQGCGQAVVDKIGEVVSTVVQIWDFVSGPVEFVETKVAEIRALIDQATSDLTGTALQAFKDLIQWDLLVNEPVQWIGSVGCGLLIDALSGTLATKVTKWVDDLLPDRPGRDRGDGDGDGDGDNGDGDGDGDNDGSNCSTNSFTGDTRVLLANGRSASIDTIRPGTLVWATDPVTGTAGLRAVSHTWDHVDTGQLVDLTVAGGSTITATDHHPIWVDNRGQYVDADNVRAGDHLLTADGVTTQVAHTVEYPTAGTRVFNLTVEDLHTFHVLAGNTPVLVHNCGVDDAWDDYDGDLSREDFEDRFDRINDGTADMPDGGTPASFDPETGQPVTYTDADGRLHDLRSPELLAERAREILGDGDNPIALGHQADTAAAAGDHDILAVDDWSPEMNRAWMEEAVEQDREIVLTTHPDDARPGSVYQQELEMLERELGYGIYGDRAYPTQGSTGRTIPGNLTEDLAMQEARSNHRGGSVIENITLNDSRWPATDGWVKVRQNINGVEIHFVRNTRTGHVDDFKFP